jgi:flagellar basal-body rod protein FlgC
MFRAIDTTASGMQSMKEWIGVTANNLSNIHTTRTESGDPYHRQTLSFQAKEEFETLFSKKIGGGVEVSEVIQDKSEKVLFNPDHPDANEEGFVRYPAVDLTAELSNMIMAQRAYEANVTVFNATKQVMQKQHEIGKL